MKKLGMAAIVFAIIFLVFTISGGICLGFGVADLAVSSDIADTLHTYAEDFNNAFSNTEYSQFSGSQTYEMDPYFTTVKVSDITGDIRIVPVASGDGNYTLTVEYDGIIGMTGSDDQQIEITSNGTVLTIASAHDYDIDFGFGGINIPDNPGRITIYIPQYTHTATTLDYDLILSNTVGDVNVTDCLLGDITIENTVGEIDIENVRAKMLIIEDTIGEVSAEGNFAGLDISNSIGEVDVDCTAPLTANSRIDDNLGEIRIDIPNSARINFTVSESIGTVSIDKPIIDVASDINFTITGGIGNIFIECDD